MEVQEIIRVPNVSTIPNAPAGVVGIASLRNRILPVVDLRTKFGFRTLKVELEGFCDKVRGFEHRLTEVVEKLSHALGGGGPFDRGLRTARDFERWQEGFATSDRLLLALLAPVREALKEEDKKLSFLESRVARRAAATGSVRSRDSYRLLKYQDPGEKEFQALVEQVATNETYFFREYPQSECFANEVLTRAAGAKRAAGDYTLNVWSACCSTGDEPYTPAIMLSACLDDFARWRVRLLATDIDTEVLDTARAGEYGERNVKDVPSVYLQQYFARPGTNTG